jgi:hypothetical protein
MEASLEIKIDLPIPKGMSLKLLQRHRYTHVYCGTIHNSQAMETAKMPHNPQME